MGGPERILTQKTQKMQKAQREVEVSYEDWMVDVDRCGSSSRYSYNNAVLVS